VVLGDSSESDRASRSHRRPDGTELQAAECVAVRPPFFLLSSATGLAVRFLGVLFLSQQRKEDSATAKTTTTNERQRKFRQTPGGMKFRVRQAEYLYGILSADRSEPRRVALLIAGRYNISLRYAQKNLTAAVTTSGMSVCKETSVLPAGRTTGLPDTATAASSPAILDEAMAR